MRYLLGPIAPQELASNFETAMFRRRSYVSNTYKNWDVSLTSHIALLAPIYS